jgi:hypothetical protein
VVTVAFIGRFAMVASFTFDSKLAYYFAKVKTTFAEISGK